MVYELFYTNVYTFCHRWKFIGANKKKKNNKLHTCQYLLRHLENLRKRTAYEKVWIKLPKKVLFMWLKQLCIVNKNRRNSHHLVKIWNNFVFGKAIMAALEYLPVFFFVKITEIIFITKYYYVWIWYMQGTLHKSQIFVIV